jgi:hypothetical protein
LVGPEIAVIKPETVAVGILLVKVEAIQVLPVHQVIKVGLVTVHPAIIKDLHLQH